jgi:hypothetical protein
MTDFDNIISFHKLSIFIMDQYYLSSMFTKRKFYMLYFIIIGSEHKAEQEIEHGGCKSFLPHCFSAPQKKAKL